MKKIIILTLLLVFVTSTYGQEKKAGSLSFGAGVSNAIMHGDLRTGFKLDDTKAGIMNLGGYAYIDKMFTPAFGLELKGHYTKMSGGAFELSAYPVQYTNETLNNTYFDAVAYGAELTTIFNLSGFRTVPFSTKERKWNFAAYTGIGWHTYTPTLYNNTTDAELINWENSPSSDGRPNSIYFTGAFGLKYKLSNNLDIELRQDFNVDEDDNLDGARSTKKQLDFFFNTSLGLVFKLNKKENNNYIWIDDAPIQPLANVKTPDFTLLDSDKDGVIDRFDKEPNTEIGALVYGNGVTIDTDKDGIPDHKDKCPLRYAKTNDGCPSDVDGDGILDDMDLCPTVAGIKANSGCPEFKPAASTNTVDIISVEPVFFDLNLFNIKKEFDQMLTKAALTLQQNPGVMLALEGHADVRGDNEYNQVLSEKRVNAVKNSLIARGVDPERISTEGFGENNPAFKSIKYSSYNRRVDLILAK